MVATFCTWLLSLLPIGDVGDRKQFVGTSGKVIVISEGSNSQTAYDTPSTDNTPTAQDKNWKLVIVIKVCRGASNLIHQDPLISANSILCRNYNHKWRGVPMSLYICGTSVLLGEGGFQLSCLCRVPPCQLLGGTPILSLMLVGGYLCPKLGYHPQPPRPGMGTLCGRISGRTAPRHDRTLDRTSDRTGCD